MITKGVSTVAREDSGKLVKHIDEAKDWLDRAKQEYCEANPIRGELILDLAQAEIKYARELSHLRFVSRIDDQSPRPAGNSQSRLILPIAAAVLVVTAVSMLWFPLRKANQKPQVMAVISEKTPAVNLLVRPTFEPSVWGELTQPAVNHPKSVVEQTEEKSLAIADSGVVQPVERNPVGVSKPVSKPIALAPLPNGSGEPAASNRFNETRGMNLSNINQPKPQPVSQLNIDVDALTKEADHSLRNGR